MKQFPKTELMSVVSVVFGIVGLVMQNWLCKSADFQGLLIPGHFATGLSIVLLLVVAAGNLLILEDVKTGGEYARLFPKSIAAAVGSFIGAAGILFSAFSFVGNGILPLLVTGLGILSAIALGYAGYCRLVGKPSSSLLFAAMAVFLIFRTLASCQVWTAEVQVQTFLFPLLAHLSLLLATYYRAALGADLKNCRQYMFFRQIAAFCCLLSSVWGEPVFFLSCAILLVTDFCEPEFYGKYANSN